MLCFLFSNKKELLLKRKIKFDNQHIDQLLLG